MRNFLHQTLVQGTLILLALSSSILKTHASPRNAETSTCPPGIPAVVPEATARAFSQFQQTLQDVSRRVSSTSWRCHFDNPSVPLDELQNDLGIRSRNGQCALTRSEVVHTLHTLRFGNQSAGPDFACNALQETIDRDSYRSCRPSSALFRGPLPRAANRRIEGTINYMGIYPAPFAYDAEVNAAGQTLIRLRVRFTRNGSVSGVSAAEVSDMQNKMRQAAEIWESGSPGRQMRFQFDVDQSSAQESHLTVNLEAEPTRGPYFANWTTFWSPRELAHEIGHQMGLDDEYHQMRVTARMGGFVGGFCRFFWGTASDTATRAQCDPSSLMCNAGDPQAIHYYLIQRRLLCENLPVEESCIPTLLEDRASQLYEPRVQSAE